jgi:hypothetical protein
MPWYYAGPEAKPVGPLSLDELHARRLNGTLSPETYVIEHTGQPGESPAWKRYRDVFPASPNLPPLPPGSSFPPAQPNPPVPHPLFPSAGAVPGALPSSASPANPHYLPARKTNTYCAWGFGLGLAAFFLSFACGVGVFPAIPAFFICIMGLMQVHRHREQAGQRRAVVGLLLSGFALLISLIFIVTLSIRFIKEHEQTTTEQTSNSSE